MLRGGGRSGRECGWRQGGRRAIPWGVDRLWDEDEGDDEVVGSSGVVAHGLRLPLKLFFITYMGIMGD